MWTVGGQRSKRQTKGNDRMNIEEQIWTGDPVLVAVGLFRGTEDNRRLWGWYCRQLGREAFRQLVYQKWRENETDGAPRNPAAAFQAMLCRYLPKARTA